MRYLWVVFILIGAIGYRVLFEKKASSRVSQKAYVDCPKPAQVQCPPASRFRGDKAIHQQTTPPEETTQNRNSALITKELNEDSTKPFHPSYENWTYSSFDEDFEKKFVSLGFTQFEDKIAMLHAAHESGLINPGTVEQLVVKDLEAYLKGEKVCEDDRSLANYFLYAQQSMQRSSPDMSLANQIDRIAASPSVDRNKLKKLSEVIGQ